LFSSRHDRPKREGGFARDELAVAAGQGTAARNPLPHCNGRRSVIVRQLDMSFKLEQVDLAKMVAAYIADSAETDDERRLQQQMAQRPKRRVIPVEWMGNTHDTAQPAPPECRAAG
jgi:hypothetical protein